MVGAMLPSRNIGVVLDGTALGQRISWGAGVFNDWFDPGKRRAAKDPAYTAIDRPISILSSRNRRS